ncbi:MAG: hypothetical protein KDB04_09740 [Acidimicrobiales bacterium]|nr:hypothetical protein [Acidimicrobiales bacterium]
MAPIPTRRRSGVVPVVVALAIAFVVGLGVVGLVVLTQDDDGLGAADRADLVDAIEDDGTALAAPASAPPATIVATPSAERTEVDGGGGLRWTMRGDPQTGSMELNPAPGVNVSVRLWSSAFGPDGDTVGIYDVGGGEFSLDSGLRGAVRSTGGTIISGPGPVTVAGRDGTMVVSTVDSNGVVGIARHAMVPVGDRILYVVTFHEGADSADAEQAFADLVASVRYG